VNINPDQKHKLLQGPSSGQSSVGFLIGIENYKDHDKIIHTILNSKPLSSF
jgi:hypothetical protein